MRLWANSRLYSINSCSDGCSDGLRRSSSHRRAVRRAVLTFTVMLLFVIQFPTGHHFEPTAEHALVECLSSMREWRLKACDSLHSDAFHIFAVCSSAYF